MEFLMKIRKSGRYPHTIQIGNKLRDIEKVKCGHGCNTLIIGNIGTTLKNDSIEEEYEKAIAAYNAGAHIIQDHSLSGNVKKLHSQLIKNLPCPVSTVSTYQCYVEYRDSDFSAEKAIEQIKVEASMGFDLVTIHASVLKADSQVIAQSNRLIPCTSRGATMMLNLMHSNNIENPFWTHFDEILSIAKEYEMCISLGIAHRPGSVVDLPDSIFWKELDRMRNLVRRAIKERVQIMVEGIGHANQVQIPKIVHESKKRTFGVPYRVLTVSCDSALYRDHIASAIASAIAVQNGADVVGAISRAEHVGKPMIDNLIEAVETAKVACHSGDLVKLGDDRKDREISMKRGISNCLAIGTETLFDRDFEEYPSDHQCSMCGPYCALKAMNRIRELDMEELL